MKLWKQILSLFLVVALFAGFNGSVYLLLTRRCTANFDTDAKAIRLEDYLPFDKNSKIVPVSPSATLTGDLPVLDGATALLPVYAAAAEALYPPEACRFEDGNFTQDSSVQYHNTVGAYRAVVDGDADLILCAAPSEEQLAYAEEKGVELTLIPIGREAMVFLVHAKNPIDGLDSDQIRGIYAGQYRSWRALGGANRPILPLQRKENSGSQTAMLAFMGDTPIQKVPFRLTGAAIGYSFRYYVETMVQNEQVKMLSIDGVYPDAAHIRSGEYPITSNFYAIYRADNPNENITAVIDWLLSDDGQHVINETGYVGLK